MHSKKIQIAIAAVLGACVIAGVWYFLSPSVSLADEMLEFCAGEGDHGQCYEKEVPKLYPRYSIKEVFNVVAEIRKRDLSYQFCHVLAHKLGEEVVAEDPSKWLDAMPQNPPNSLCSNGFIHGVIVGRFRNDVLDESTIHGATEDFKKACEPRENWAPSPLDQAICYHGMGHLFTFITNADLMRALEVCDAVGQSPTGNFMRVCREGVYMQIYQPLEPDDFELVAQLEVKPTKENYRDFCKTYSSRPEEEGACLREAWPMFRPELLDGTGAARFCSNQPNPEEEDSCYQSVSSIIGRMSLGKSAKTDTACRALPSKRQAMCYSFSAQSILEEDLQDSAAAVDFCSLAPEGVDDECLEGLARRASFTFPAGSPLRESFCAALPEKHQLMCRGGTR